MACIDLTPSRALCVILLIIIVGLSIEVQSSRELEQLVGLSIEVQSSRELEQSKNVALMDLFRSQMILEQNKIPLNQTKTK